VRFRNGPNSKCPNFVQISEKCDGDLAMIRQAFREESRAVHGKSKFTEIGETGEEQG
jgi:hypothetical protein